MNRARRLVTAIRRLRGAVAVETQDFGEAYLQWLLDWQQGIHRIGGFLDEGDAAFVATASSVAPPSASSSTPLEEASPLSSVPSPEIAEPTEAFRLKRQTAGAQPLDEVIASGDISMMRLRLSRIQEQIVSIDTELNVLTARDWYGKRTVPWSQENQAKEDQILAHRRDLHAQTHRLNNAIMDANVSARRSDRDHIT